MIETVLGTDRDRDGQLRLAAGRLLAERLMPSWLLALSAHYPQVGVSVRVLVADQDIIEVVRAGSADLGFVGACDVPGDLAGQQLARDRLLVVVAPGHPWTRLDRPLSGADLAATRLVLRHKGTASRRVVDHALAPWGGPRRPAKESVFSSVLRDSAARGVAPALLSEIGLGSYLTDGRLVEIPVSPTLHLRRTVHAIWLAGQYLPASARYLLRISAQRLNEVPTEP